MIDDDELLHALVGEVADDEEPAKEEPRMQVFMLEGETLEEAKARAALTSEYHAADSIWVLNQVTAFKEADLTNLAEQLERQVKTLGDGDLSQAESMLASQAFTLNALFHSLLKRSTMNVGHYFDAAEKYMKLALKAQSQCRTTVDSLSSMKRPPELIRQTNIAHGHQQVNNFPKKQKPPNELLEEKDGLDGGTPQQAIRGDQTMETVAAKHGSKDK